MVFVELVINGIVQGSLLGIVCIGYSLAYGSAKVINFAHADVLIVGGAYLVLLFFDGPVFPDLTVIGMASLFSLSVIITSWPWSIECSSNNKQKLSSFTLGIISFSLISICAGKLNFVTAFILSIPFTSFLATSVFRIGYDPLIKKEAPRTSILLSALGFSIALESFMLVLWGSSRRIFPTEKLPTLFVVKNIPDHTNSIQSILNSGQFFITQNITIPIYDIIIVIVFVVLLLAINLFFKRSIIAHKIIAAADSKIAARTCGINVSKSFSIAFLIGGALASIGGTLFILRTNTIYPTAGFSLGIIAFLACVVGGIGSIRGSVAGAFLVSFILSLSPMIPLEEMVLPLVSPSVAKYLPSLNPSDWSYAFVYLLVIFTILVKPKGMFTK